jgi:hypothetical protein
VTALERGQRRSNPPLQFFKLRSIFVFEVSKSAGQADEVPEFTV